MPPGIIPTRRQVIINYRRHGMNREKRFSCERCALRRFSERKPQSIIARIWKWHTGWCPGWKAYQRHLSDQAKTV